MKCIYCKDTKKLNGKFECWYCKEHIVDINKNVSPVRWLWDKLKKGEFINNPDELFEQALQMEMEQQITTFNESRLTHPMIGWKHRTFEEYYNETFKND